MLPVVIAEAAMAIVAVKAARSEAAVILSAVSYFLVLFHAK